MSEEYQNPPDDSEQRYEQYLKERDELLKRELLNTVNLDKSVLSLSTAGLGFSLVLLRYLFPVGNPGHKWILYLSWAMFGLAIMLTLGSYLLGQHAIKQQLKLNERLILRNNFFLSNTEDAPKKRPLSAKITDWLKYFYVAAYILALSFLFLFIGLNN
ncbi:hypothetical protein C6495_08105 [Candidatus Poribacteria bacterium]|nr:MAG: hypothetical protein C6495_08105 [Candidatus Poribacteria bacterium]